MTNKTPLPKMLFVFLNNPEDKYNHTPHNVAMYYLENFTKNMNLVFNRFSTKSSVARAFINQTEVLFLKPLTYMNNSGLSVMEIANFYKILPSNIVIFHDDIDLKPTELKLKSGGGTAGHNGLKSINNHIENTYNRLRIGVGKQLLDNNINIDVADFVLTKMPQNWIDIQQKKLEIFLQTSDLLIDQQYEKFNALTTQNIKLAEL